MFTSPKRAPRPARLISAVVLAASLFVTMPLQAQISGGLEGRHVMLLAFTRDGGEVTQLAGLYVLRDGTLRWRPAMPVDLRLLDEDVVLADAGQVEVPHDALLAVQSAASSHGGGAVLRAGPGEPDFALRLALTPACQVDCAVLAVEWLGRDDLRHIVERGAVGLMRTPQTRPINPPLRLR
ncbi:MAG: hypothetical protein KC620_16470 [Myxococcales bacterium]|nr:hypothetical protein [Myxococcales bacterium]